MQEIQNFIKPFFISRPEILKSPILISSPHSGNFYPKNFLEITDLSVRDLRSSEDSYIDQIFESAINIGSPIIKAIYPRTYVDLNREPFELDPTMFKNKLPDHINTKSHRVLSGLGTIAKYAGNKKVIYKEKLDFDNIINRINRIYYPYHYHLRKLINQTIIQFGFCILLDCHSMPSAGLPLNHKNKKIDITLGNMNGASCSDLLLNKINNILREKEFDVSFNNPYAGGFITQNYGIPNNGVHVIQIEINREIYLDERNLQKKSNFHKIQKIFNLTLNELNNFVLTNQYNFLPHKMSAE